MKKKTKKKSGLFLEFDTPIRITEYKNGKKLNDDPIDSDVIGKLIIHAIEEGLKKLC